MTTNRGTNHFANFSYALRYYEEYGYNEQEIRDKIDNKEINIGRPTITENQFTYCDSSGRYFIIERNV